MSEADESTDQNRREHPRAAISTTATVLARYNAGVPCTIESLSIGGARLKGAVSVEVGEEVRLLFEIDASPIELVGEVVRVEKEDILSDRIAVRFVEMSGELRGVLKELVLRTLEREDQPAPDP